MSGNEMKCHCADGTGEGVVWRVRTVARGVYGTGNGVVIGVESKDTANGSARSRPDVMIHAILYGQLKFKHTCSV